MAITRLQAVIANAATTTITVTYGSTPTVGNRLFLIVNSNKVITTVPAGWALLKGHDQGTSLSTAIYWKVAGVSEPTGVTVTSTGANPMQAAVLEYSGLAADGVGVGPFDHFVMRDDPNASGINSFDTGAIIGTRAPNELWLGALGGNSTLTTGFTFDSGGFSTVVTNNRLVVMEKIVSARSDAEAAFHWTSLSKANSVLVALADVPLGPQHVGFGMPVAA